MNIGVPTEIKNHEYRVAMTPAGVKELTDLGHQVFVQAGAGLGSHITDEEYVAQGAQIVEDAAAVFARAKVIVKVKEPQSSEVALLTDQHVLFTYLHLAADLGLAENLAATGATCVAYETITDAGGRLPLLAPMSEVAGKIAVQAGARLLEKAHGGRGVLLGGVTGVGRGHVVVIGGGIAGENAARVAHGMGAYVTVFDRNLDRLRQLEGLYPGIQTRYSTALAIEETLAEADIVVGSVLIRGAKAPHVISRSQLALMKPGSVLVDISIDQGGCFETSRATTHQEPSYEVDGIVHYCVANIPGAVPVTSTAALTNATLPYLLRLLDHVDDEVDGSLLISAAEHEDLVNGINVYRGFVTEPNVHALMDNGSYFSVAQAMTVSF